MASKPCPHCGVEVNYFQVNSEWVPINTDNSAHTCKGVKPHKLPQNLNDLTRPELQKLANDLKLNAKGEADDDTTNAKTWRASARRNELIEALTTYSNSNNGEGGGESKTKSKGGGNHECDWERIESIVDDKIARSAKWIEAADILAAKINGVQPIEVHRHDGSVENVGRQHYLFPRLLEYVSRGLHVFLVGPAGSGKTTAIEGVAKALNRTARISSMSSQTPEARMMGYNDAHGHYVPGILYDPYTKGQLLGLDEMDNSNPNVLAALNSALSNSRLGFPHGMMDRHSNFVVIATGNTYGTGANRIYVGRQQIDGATLDRFVVMDWPYDEAFELDLARSKTDDEELREEIAIWVRRVQSYRHAADKHGIRIIISPRASLHGATLIATKTAATTEELESSVIWRGLDADSIKKVKAEAAKERK